jgi:mRNA-degrading endonuclease RelE of RelBE toxin-antitoxin system
MKPKMMKVNVRFTPDQFEIIKNLSKLQNKSVSKIIRELALESLLNRIRANLKTTT